MRQVDPADLAARVVAQSRADIARAITLVESSRADHRAQASELITALTPHTGGSVRVGITGSRVSPPLFESIELLGRESSLARLRSLRESL